MAIKRSDVGFWAAVGRLRLAEVLTVETGASLFMGGALGVLLWRWGSAEDRLAAAGHYLVVLPALVAIVFAGLALVAAFLSDSYLRLLRSAPSGVLGFFSPFLLAVGVQIGAVLGTVAYLALGPNMPECVEQVAFVALSVLFVAACLELVVLTRSVLMHVLLRSRLGEVAGGDDSGQPTG